MTKIIFIDDIFRKEIAEARQCIYKTIKTIFKRAFDINIWAPRFSSENIFGSIMNKYKDIDWTNVYFKLPEAIEKEYIKLLDKSAIYISYEAPVWLYKIWQKYHIKYIDIRLSYLRFLPDIPMMLSTNINSMIPILQKFRLDEKDILMEAGLCKASYNFRHFSDHRNIRRFENALVFIGQTAKDTSLMVEGFDRVVKINDFEKEMRDCFSSGRQIFYKPHPFASVAHQQEEQKFLEKLTHQRVSKIRENFYNLAVQDFPIDFVGLSSGALKEAEFFGKNSLMLMDFPFAERKTSESLIYVNIESYYFLSPKFWQECLEKELPVIEKCKTYRDPHAGLMREHHNASWGFNEFYYENRISVSDQLNAWGSSSVLNLMKWLTTYSADRRRYWRYKLLSKLTFGKMRKKYQQKKKDMKARLKQVRKFLKK